MAAKAARFTPRHHAPGRKIRSCCSRSTGCGASTWSPSITCPRSIGWRGLAQRDPLNEYKQEAYELFQTLLTNLRELVTTQLSHVEIQLRQPEPQPAPEPALAGAQEVHINPQTGENEVALEERPENKVLTDEQLKSVRRNDPCPCGSGKKFKHCHGAY